MGPKQSFYDQEEVHGKLLGWRIKQQQTERTITNIENANGNTLIDSLEINTAF